MNIDMLIIGIWGYLWIVCGFLTFVAMILCLILKEKKRSIAVDVLLVIASITLLIMSLASVLPLAKSSKVKMKAPFEVRLKQASSSIETATSSARIEKSNNVLSWVVNLNYPVTNSTKQLASARKNLASLVSDYPKSASARMAYALFIRGFGGNIKLAGKNSKEGSIYSRELKPIFESNKAPSRDSTNAIYEVINNDLPDGWFKQEATLFLNSLERKDTAHIKKEIEFRQVSHDKKMLPLLILYIVITYIATLVGAVILFDCIRSSEIFERDKLQIDYLSGRKVLGVALIVSYVIVILSIILNMLPKVEIPLNMSKALETLSGCLVGLVVTLIAVKHVISRPLDIGILEVLDLKFSTSQLPKYLKDGFWGLMLCSFIYGVVWTSQSLIVGSVNSDNPINWQMEALADSSAYFALAITAFAIVVVGPAFEELLFRALLYKWFRSKFGVSISAIVSSLIFAAYHFDFQMMPGLTVMGIAMAITYEKSGSIYASIFLHAFINAWFVFCTQLVR